MGLFEDLGLIDKHPDVIKKEIEESNEANYREHFLEVKREASDFKDKHKEIIEDRLQKSISDVTLKELIELGFNSDNLTRKHCVQILNDEAMVKVKGAK